MKNKFVILLLLMVVVLFIFVVYEKIIFPIKYVICDSLYKNCFVHAKFKDMDSCQVAKEKGGWYCDQTDKRDIRCEDKESEISTAYCSK